MSGTFDTIKTGDTVKIPTRGRYGIVVYKNDSYLVVEYTPERVKGKRGRYRESFVRHDANKMVVPTLSALCS